MGPPGWDWLAADPANPGIIHHPGSPDLAIILIWWLKTWREDHLVQAI
jgi:hypothetical protein